MGKDYRVSMVACPGILFVQVANTSKLNIDTTTLIVVNFIGAKNHSVVKVNKIHKYAMFYSVHSYNCSASLENAINIANKIVNKEIDVEQTMLNKEQSAKKNSKNPIKKKQADNASNSNYKLASIKSNIKKYESDFSSREEFCEMLSGIIKEKSEVYMSIEQWSK
jgi:hypothetical protein